MREYPVPLHMSYLLYRLPLSDSADMTADKACISTQCMMDTIISQREQAS
jgi:hypothetical protein